MSGRPSRRFLRTYGRRQPYQRRPSSAWLSPHYQQHLFSSSSSASALSSPGDADYRPPAKRAGKRRRRRQGGAADEEKENGGSPPAERRRFVTERRRPARPPEADLVPPPLLASTPAAPPPSRPLRRASAASPLLFPDDDGGEGGPWPDDFLHDAKVFQQPVVLLYRCALNPRGGQGRARASPPKDAELKPQLSGAGSLSPERASLGGEDSAICGKLDMGQAANSPPRANRGRPPKASQRTLPPPCNGTGRKGCISGFSSKRWAKRARPGPASAAAKQRRGSFQESQLSLGDHGLGLGTIILNDSTESNDSRLESVGLLNSSPLNASAFRNLSPNSSCLQYWTQLRATLSLHKKKKVELQAGGQDWAGINSERGYLDAPTPLQLSNIKTPSGKQLNRCHPLPKHSMSLLTPAKYLPLSESFLTDAEKVYEECQQEGAVSFSECIPPGKMRSCEKIGEGVFGEVFKTIDNGNYVALKIIPIEGKCMVNGEAQKSFGEILPEIIISRELSLLCEGCENSTDGFIKLHSVHCVKGSYPQHLLQAWDTYDKNKGSENDNPALFESDQLFIILEFDFGGNDLESMTQKLASVASAKSILQQVIVALAVAEETLHFEHRDLHWGNILVKQTNVKKLKYNLHGLNFDIPTRGVQASIIDYTLSRLEKDGLIVFCDIADDETLFQGQGDYQFDVYRSMRQENANSWSEYNPHSNVLWLHYLADKLINEIKYRSKPTTSAMKGIHKKLVQFHAEVLGFVSASEVLQKSSLFR
uniref:Serine/threonine-protein kinase haspin n=1 Tax=Geotrypetes seraphini TaxID=260995 RepID=A0A6P8QFV2_GEOSA|nr:serine/threonine-protein kinase haspin [Geotrypetes seraphini]